MQAIEHFHDHEHDHDHDHHHHDHSRENLQAWLKTGLLLGLGLYFLYNIASGSLSNYINVRFAWLSYLAVAMFLLLSLSSAVDLLRQGKRKNDDHNHEHDHDHDHAQISWGMLAIIAIPLVLGTLIPSRPLGADAVGGSISLNVASSSNTFTSNPQEWNVLDWLRAFNNSGDVSTFNGQEANVIGFVYKEITFGEDQFMVARFTISCCVADASAIGLPVIWNQAGSLPQDTWVRVQGTFEVGEFRENTVPMLRATSVETVKQPEHPYLYP